MPTATQIFLLLCLRANVAVSTDGGGVRALIRDFFGSGPVYEQSRFTPFSFHAAEKLDYHNGSIERGPAACYDPGYSCNGALCCDNGSCAGTGQVCCGIGICDAGYGCCDNHCVLLTDTCCDGGSYCPAGQGCFSYDNSNQIFCSPTGGGTGPATSTVKPESTPSSVNHPTTVVPASSSVYYYTYEYEWTTFYYIYEIESFTTYIVTTVLSAVATDAAAASASFNAFTVTFVPTAPPTSLPGASTPSPSPSPTASTVPASTSSASHSTRSSSTSSSTSTGSSVASQSGAGPSANIRGGTLSAMCTVGIVMIMIIL